MQDNITAGATYDLKIGKLTHQDVGQIDTYVRIYDQHRKGSDDNPTIGLILCSEKSEAVAKYSVLTESKQLFASKYLHYLPTEEELRSELERERAALNQLPDIQSENKALINTVKRNNTRAVVDNSKVLKISLF